MKVMKNKNLCFIFILGIHLCFKWIYKFQNKKTKKKMNNEFTMSLTSNFGLTPDKVGLTTTVKQQVQHIEVNIVVKLDDNRSF